jgi:uncharacterized membrane protein
MNSAASPDVMPRHSHKRVEPSNNSRLGPLLGALALIAVLTPLQRLWAVQLLLTPLLLTIPGVILLRALRVPGKAVLSCLVYIPCSSMAILIASGLAVDLIGPLVRIDEPLRTVPLLTGLEITCIVLLVSTVNCSRDIEIPWDSLQPSRLIWPFVIPVVSIIGALRLNTGHGNALAVAMLCSCLVLLMAGTIFSAGLDKGLLSVILYATDLALIWNFSLRGDLVYGFDIATEYYDLNQAVLTGIWHTGHAGDAYGAMLTVTIMPAELHFLSGVPALLVFKVVYPAISALFPVAIFFLAQTILSRSWAFIAAASFVVQDLFAQESAAVARQEIALVMFAGLTVAMLDTRISRRPRWLLVGVFSLTMVLSHYSTTYIAITLLGLTMLLQWVASWFRKIPHITGAIALAFALCTGGAIIWYDAVTHSAITGAKQVAESVGTQGLNFLPNRSPGENPITAYLDGNTSTPIPASKYQQLVSEYYKKNEPNITPLADSNLAKYDLKNSAPPVTPIRFDTAYQAIGLMSILVQQICYLLGAVGALLMVVRRKASELTRQIGLLGLSTMIFLVLIRVSGTLAVAYNQDRALLQAMPILAIPVCWALQSLVGQRKRYGDRARVLAAGSLASLFIGSSGLLGIALGGGVATNLANSGEDYERFYMATPELAAAQWLGGKIRNGQLLYADRYAQLSLVAMTGIGSDSDTLIGDITPLTLSSHAWIFASQTNVVDGRARALFDNHTVTYTFPEQFLVTNYNLVYTNGSSEVFNR